MKSKVLIMVLVISLAAATIGGFTAAWFTDADTSEPVSFTAGTLLIDIDNFNLVTENFNIGNLNPGDEWEYQFNVVNNGTKNLIFTGLLCYEDTIGQKNPDAERALLVEKDYGTDPLSEILQVELSVGGQPFYTGTLADFVNGTNSLGGYPGGGLPVYTNSPIVFGEAQLNSGDTYPYTVKLSLPQNADNRYQGSSLEAAFVVLARQASYADESQYPAFECPFYSMITFEPGTLNPWYEDRKLPYEFTTVTFDGDDRLKHSIDASGVPTDSFYQYQGMKYDTPGATFYSIDLYIPDDWATTDFIRAGMWATANNGNLSYPIIEFTTNETNPRFRVWQSNIGWVDIGLPTGFSYDKWYTLDIRLDPGDGGDVTYSVGDRTYVLDNQHATEFINVILQGHNPMPNGATYDIYWDNFKFN